MSQKQLLGVVLGTSLAFIASPAFAVDVDAFVTRIETAGVGGLTYLGRARAAGEAVVVDNVGVKFGDTTLLLEGQFTFSGITMQPDGGYVVDSITAPEIVLRDNSTRVVTAKLNDFSFTGYVVPGKSGPDGTLRPLALHTGLFTWREVPMTVDAFSIEIEPTFANEAVTGVAVSAAVKGMTVNLPDVPRESDAFAKTLVALGVDKLTFDFSDSLVWRDTGLLTYSSQTGLGEFGEARTEIVANGVTRAKLEDISMAWITAQTDDPLNARASTAWADPILGLAIGEASFRYDAGPLLPQLLDYLGTELGGRDAVSTVVESAIMTEVENLGLPALDALVRPGLRAFLAEPSSLEARIDPPAPTTFISLSAATMTNKAGIVPLLGLSITANEPPRADAP